MEATETARPVAALGRARQRVSRVDAASLLEQANVQLGEALEHQYGHSHGQATSWRLGGADYSGHHTPGNRRKRVRRAYSA